MNKIIVVAVHPDDETLACGGTLLKHIDNGDEVYWVIVTGISEELGFSSEIVAKREKEIKEVAEKYKFTDTIQFKLPTMRLDELPFSKLISLFSSVFNKIQPNILYLPFKADVHTDHQVVFTTVFSCTKNFRYPFIEKVYMMETISETDFAPALNENAFIPNYYVNISNYLKKKQEILMLYKGEMGEHPFPRSLRNIEALATIRGSQIGKEYAESFILLKEIVN
jgi:LmbE family N-acetylglucosaminyl deacetylase